MSKRQHESRTGFHQPENYDRTHEGTGWNFWQGANDWEHAPTWMWVVFPGDSENKRVWVEVNYEGHGNPDDGEVRYDGPEAKEAKAWGEKAIKTWLRVAKRLHSEKKEHDIQRQWIDAFKDALQDDEVKAFIKQSGTDRTNWEPMKESKAIVAALLEDDEVERLTDEIAANGYVVVATGEAGQKLYYVANRFRFSSYAKDAQVFATPEGAKEAMQHANALHKYQNTRIEAWLGEGEEDPKDFIDRQNMQRGFTVQVGVVNPLRRRKLTWYYSTHEGELVKELQVLSRARASYLMRRFRAKYDPKRIKLGQAYHPGNPNDAMFENEADDFIERMDKPGYQQFVVKIVGPEVCYWYATDDKFEGLAVRTAAEATKYPTVVDAMVGVNAAKRSIQSNHPDVEVSLEHYTPAVKESDEADEFLGRVGDTEGDYVAILQASPTQRPHYLNSHGHWSLQWSDDVPCSQLEAMRRMIRNTSEFPTNAQHSKIVPRGEAFDYQSIWYDARNDTSCRRVFNVFNAFWGKPKRLESLIEAVYKRSSCQINAPEDIADFLIQWGMLNIPDEKLYIEPDGGCGREDEPHITVRYGLDFPEAPEEFHRLITTWKAFPIRLAGVSLFKNDKFDVVKLDVISDDLLRLNAEIRKQFPSQQPDKFPDYHPHLTIAYVQPGTCDALEGADPFKASTDVVPQFEADRLRFSGAGDTDTGDRNIQFIPFDKTQSTEQRREELAAEVVEALVENEADEFLGRVSAEQFVIKMEVIPPSYRQIDPTIGGYGRWVDLENATPMAHAAAVEEVKNLRHHPSMRGFDMEIVPLKSLHMESAEEADEFLDRLRVEKWVVRCVPHRGEVVYGSISHSHSTTPEPMSKYHADLVAREYRKCYADVYVEPYVGPVREALDPFNGIGFPTDAAEVLTKVRSRRSHRGAPTWF